MKSDIYYSSNDSKAGTPIENPNLPADVDDGNDLEKLDFSSKFASPNGASATFSGTDGANTFEFEALLNAKPEIIAKHVDGDGKINWRGVAGENDNYHDHWVDSIGKIEIKNFNSSEGDKIIFRGHTVQAVVLDDSDGIATIGIISDQGNDNSRGNGAHDLDVLGIAEVHHNGDATFGDGKKLNKSIVDDISNNQFGGVVDNISKLPIGAEFA